MYVGPERQTYALQPRLIDGVWVSVTKPGDWFGNDIVVDTAPAPQGPWTRVRTMAAPTKTIDGTTNTYLPHLLPWRSPLGNLVVTMSHNAWDMPNVASPRPWLYRPTFFEVEPPDTMPSTPLAATTPPLGFVASAPKRALDTRSGPVVACRRDAAACRSRRPRRGDAQAVAVDLVGVEPRNGRLPDRMVVRPAPTMGLEPERRRRRHAGRVRDRRRVGRTRDLRVQLD